MPRCLSMNIGKIVMTSMEIIKLVILSGLEEKYNIFKFRFSECKRRKIF